MNNFLLIDFGASFIKTAEINSDTIRNVKNYPCPKITATNVDEIFNDICSFSKNIDGIFICTQMHGFFALDKDNNPLTEYINWQDAMAGEKIEGISTFDLVAENFTRSFRQKTGMNLKMGLPILNLIHLARTNKLKQDIKVVSIPEFLVLKNCDEQTNLVHDTILAGMGFYDIYEDKPYQEILDFYKKISGKDIIFNKCTKKVESAGYINKVPVYVGVGDHQCALFGADLSDKNELSINLGTGSQVSFIDELKPSGIFEQRPFFENKMLSTITHIPSGRVLSQFVKDWEKVAELDLSDIENAQANIDLAIFDGAYGYKGSKISDIKIEDTKEYLANLFRSYLDQYINIIEKLETKPEKIILSGGIARKLKFVKQYLQNKTNIEITISNGEEETLLGLKKLTTKGV